VVEFEMPFGFVGRLLENHVMKELETMFEYRHKATKELLA